MKASRKYNPYLLVIPGEGVSIFVHMDGEAAERKNCVCVIKTDEEHRIVYEIDEYGEEFPAWVEPNDVSLKMRGE